MNQLRSWSIYLVLISVLVVLGVGCGGYVTPEDGANLVVFEQMVGAFVEMWPGVVMERKVATAKKNYGTIYNTG